ncbi:MAG: PAS domain S-box protein, partial [Syntrophobacteraceae bacterium]
MARQSDRYKLLQARVEELEAALRRAHDESERRVAERTAELRTSAERERTEEALRISRQTLLDIIEFLPDATFVIDQDKRVIAWNRACEIMTGVKKEAVLGLGDYAYDDLFFGGQKPILIDLPEMPSPEMESKYKYVKAKYKYVSRAGNTFFAECFNPRLRGGRGAHLWIAATPLFDREKRCCGAIEVIRDVTDQKRVEEALRESEEKFFAAFNHAPVMAAITVLEDGTFLDVNNKFLEVSGFTRSEVLGRTSVEVGWLRAEDRLRLVELFHKQGNLSDMEYTARSRDGRPIHCLYRCELVTIGGVKRLLTMSLDITERKLAEQALRESERKYRELVELANSVILRWTHDGRITFLNEFGQRFFGYSAEEIIGRHVVGTIVPPVESSGRDL